MKLTFDNLDGLGAIDYSASLERSEPVVIERALNAPSTARGNLCLYGSALATPVRRARIVLSSEGGTTLFTGYLTTEPVAVYAGAASEGSVYRLAFSAVSDEWLLDKQAAGSTSGQAFSSPVEQVLGELVTRLDAGLLAAPAGASGRRVGVFDPAATGPAASARWSERAGSAASAGYSAYHAIDGALLLTPAGSVVHALSDGDGTLSVAALRTSAIRELANDVTVSGEMEPSAYWTELFLGDGTTAIFPLQGQPDAPGAEHAVLLNDSFTGAAFNRQSWQLADPGSHLSLGGAGLLLNGGNGFDGQTTLSAFTPLELGGTVVFELASVALNAGSAGVLAGLYDGAIEQANCFAGFNVAQAAGNTILQPIVNGLLTGTPYTLAPGSLYTLRMHLHSPELQRVKQVYYASVDGVVEQFGGGYVTAPAALVLEIRDLGTSSNTPVTRLYEGSVASAPVQATVVAVNSVQLFGSVGAVTLARTGSAWITSADPVSGAVAAQLAGRQFEGVDCTLTSSATEGKVTFFAGRVPVPNAPITVQYRGRRRAMARLADAASLAAEAAGGAPGTARWLGKIVRPQARSSEDCEQAARAILSFATNRAAAVSGAYTAVNPPPGDIWPGDVLALSTEGVTTNVLVRRVEIEEQGAAPEALTYRIAFANDWAEGLGLTLSEAIAADALLPASALQLAPGASAAPVLANLQQLSVISATASALTIDAGNAPPAGGGFEVRRHDGGFGSGTAGSASGDLVLRSPVRGFLIPRATFQEKFFIRMYDASLPPLFSRESAAIATYLPTA